MSAAAWALILELFPAALECNTSISEACSECLLEQKGAKDAKKHISKEKDGELCVPGGELRALLRRPQGTAYPAVFDDQASDMSCEL